MKHSLLPYKRTRPNGTAIKSSKREIHHYHFSTFLIKSFNYFHYLCYLNSTLFNLNIGYALYFFYFNNSLKALDLISHFFSKFLNSLRTFDVIFFFWNNTAPRITFAAKCQKLHRNRAVTRAANKSLRCIVTQLISEVRQQ